MISPACLAHETEQESTLDIIGVAAIIFVSRYSTWLDCTYQTRHMYQGTVYSYRKESIYGLRETRE